MRDILMKSFHDEGERKMGRGMMKEYGKERHGMRGKDGKRDDERIWKGETWDERERWEEMFGKRMRKEVT